jgi:hypothetical protein
MPTGSNKAENLQTCYCLNGHCHAAWNIGFDHATRPSFVIDRPYLGTNNHSRWHFRQKTLFLLDVLRKRFRILRVSRYLQPATLERADCFDHGEGDEARFKEILDEAFATVLHDRILMLLFAVGFGKRTERIKRTNLGYHC